MDTDNIYLYLSNEDKTASTVTNEAHNFAVHLPLPLWLDIGQWEMALQSVSYEGLFLSSPPPKMVSVCCDVIESSIIHGSQAQVLRRLVNRDIHDVHWDFDQLQYKRIISNAVTTVRIYLLNEKGELAILSPGSWIYCTLHLQRRNILMWKWFGDNFNMGLLRHSSLSPWALLTSLTDTLQKLEGTKEEKSSTHMKQSWTRPNLLWRQRKGGLWKGKLLSKRELLKKRERLHLQRAHQASWTKRQSGVKLNMYNTHYSKIKCFKKLYICICYACYIINHN